ncbi:MAG: hypothetical protein PHW73_01060 [Atribacterota bacterium]|nr:hypothetical protein [Atribacterota bacterium]
MKKNKIILILFILMCLPIMADCSVFLFLVSPTKMVNSVKQYDTYFSKAYSLKNIIYTGSDLDKFKKDYQQLINNSNQFDTIIMVWVGHTGLTLNPKYRGGACFILSNKMDNDIDQKNELFGYDAINAMIEWLTIHYGYRIVLIMDTCYAGLLVKSFKRNTKATILLSVNSEQENLYFPSTETCWFSTLLLESINRKKNSIQLIADINKIYRDKKEIYENIALPEYRKKKAIEYYPFKAIHLGIIFNFK